MSFPVILNSQNYVSANTYKVSLSSTVDLSDFECSLGAMNLYYSWYSINSYPLNNDQFTLTIPRSGGSDTLNITIPPGAYNISDLNSYLQYRLIQGGYYLINTASGQNLYYASFQISQTAYQVQLITSPLPTSLPAGYSSGGMTFPAAANQHYQLTVLSTNNFGKIIGFAPGTFPTLPTNIGVQTNVSTIAPDVNPVSSVQMRLSCLYNPFSSNSQLLHVFSNKGQAFGSLIDASPNYESYVPCSGYHQELVVSFFDQNGYILNILDRNLIIKLNFRKALKEQQSKAQ